MFSVPLLLALAVTTAFSVIAFPYLIRLARARSWVDLPSLRKKHRAPVPIVGGVCIFSAWGLGMFLTQAFGGGPSLASLLCFGAAIVTLLALGLWDDLRGARPGAKLVVQTAVAVGTIFFEPGVRAVCAQKAAGMQPALALPLVYLPVTIWIVGVMNAINLIDGIDGFAGGTSLLIAASTIVLNLLPGGGNMFAVQSLVFLIPPLLVFLRHNWSPAKIFLGDNGSLSLGYVLAVNGLLYRQTPVLLVSVPCLLIMFAYPILDMGFCVYRRVTCGYPIFKADRNHLHHRIQRLGLTNAQTTGFLLCLVAYSQITAIFLNSVHFQLVLVSIASFALSFFIFVYLLGSAERWCAQLLLRPLAAAAEDAFAEPHASATGTVISIDLNPLLEVGRLEEKANLKAILTSLHTLVSRGVRPADSVVVNGTKLQVRLAGAAKSEEECELFKARLRERLASFQALYGLQYSLVGLPVVVEGEHDSSMALIEQRTVEKREHVA